MNKKGFGGLAIISAIMIFVVGMLVINLIKPEIDTFRSVDALDCANTSISDGAKLTCLTVDATIPYFILMILSVVGGLLLENFIK